MIALSAHALGLLTALGMAQTPRAQSAKAVSTTQWIEVQLPAPEEAPPQPEPEPEPPPPERLQPVRRPRPVARTEPPPTPPPAPVEEPPSDAPAPEAAEAGEVLTADAPAEVLDLTDTMISGTGKRFAGGTTQVGGTAREAVRAAQARAGGVPGGTGHGTVDHSRPPQLAGRAQWRCPMPEEALDQGIDEALVTVRVVIDEAGQLLEITAVEDPGFGFFREARRCAYRKRWLPGLDRSGRPTQAAQLVKIRFEAY